MFLISTIKVFTVPNLSVLVLNVTDEQATDTVEVVNVSKVQWVQLQVTVTLMKQDWRKILSGTHLEFWGGLRPEWLNDLELKELLQQYSGNEGYIHSNCC